MFVTVFELKMVLLDLLVYGGGDDDGVNLKSYDEVAF